MTTAAAPVLKKSDLTKAQRAMLADFVLSGRWFAAKRVRQRPGQWKDQDPAKHPERWHIATPLGEYEFHHTPFLRLIELGVVTLEPYPTGKFGDEIEWYTVRVSADGIRIAQSDVASPAA